MLSAITNEKLMSLTLKALYDEEIDAEIRDFILFVAFKNGLVNENGERTGKYFARMNGDLELLIRKLTGHEKQASGLCACGCGRDPGGRGKYATQACRKKMSRTLKRLKKEAFQVPDLQ